MSRDSKDNKKSGNAQDKSQIKMEINRTITFETIGSTNTWAKEHVEEWAADGVTLVSANEQTAGRGRFNRRWLSPKNVNIYATYCFWIDIGRTDLGHIPQLLALSAAQVLETLGFHPQIKWPNDLLLAGKKIGGILCETIMENEQRGIVCGIGLNINMPHEVLESIDQPATSLLMVEGKPFDPNRVLNALNGCFMHDLDVFLRDGFTPFFPLYQARSAYKKGDKVKFHNNQIVIEAIFDSYHPDGSVLLQLVDGTSKLFYAGEFVY